MGDSGDVKAIAENLKVVMRRFPQGVTVVTMQSEDHQLGITVASFTSISLTPPLILVSIAKGSFYHDTIVNAKSFAVNILASDQGDVSERFAGKVPQGEDRFHNVKFQTGLNGAPLIQGALSWIECRNRRTIEAGDHTIVLGEVTTCKAMKEATPLLYFNRQYATIAQLEPIARDYETLFMGW